MSDKFLETSKTLRNDMKVWQNEFMGKQLKVGRGGLGMLLLIFRACLAILERLEEERTRPTPDAPERTE